MLEFSIGHLDKLCCWNRIDKHDLLTLLTRHTSNNSALSVQKDCSDASASGVWQCSCSLQWSLDTLNVQHRRWLGDFLHQSQKLRSDGHEPACLHRKQCLDVSRATEDALQIHPSSLNINADIKKSIDPVKLIFSLGNIASFLFKSWIFGLKYCSFLKSSIWSNCSFHWFVLFQLQQPCPQHWSWPRVCWTESAWSH